MYKVTLSDNTVFTGGCYTNSKWNSIPNIPIKKLEYFIGKTKITMSDYDSYNHLVEKKWVNGMGQFITAIILFGGFHNKITRIRYDLINSNNNTKEKMITYHENGKEYDEKSTTGWKTGIYKYFPTPQLEINLP